MNEYFVSVRTVLKGLYTCRKLLACFNDWAVMLQDYQSVTVVYIDIAKAFDTISHKTLIYRSEQDGITGCLFG